MTNSISAEAANNDLTWKFIRAAIKFGAAASGSLQERAAAGVAHAFTVRGITAAARAAATTQREAMTSRVATAIALRTETPPTRPQMRRGSKEWNRMWAALKLAFGDTVQVNGFESWQYMGQADGQHEFRHRAHPVFGRHYWRTPVAA